MLYRDLHEWRLSPTIFLLLISIVISLASWIAHATVAQTFSTLKSISDHHGIVFISGQLNSHRSHPLVKLIIMLTKVIATFMIMLSSVKKSMYSILNIDQDTMSGCPLQFWTCIFDKRAWKAVRVNFIMLWHNQTARIFTESDKIFPTLVAFGMQTSYWASWTVGLYV